MGESGEGWEGGRWREGSFSSSCSYSSSSPRGLGAAVGASAWRLLPVPLPDRLARTVLEVRGRLGAAPQSCTPSAAASLSLSLSLLSAEAGAGRTGTATSSCAKRWGGGGGGGRDCAMRKEWGVRVCEGGACMHSGASRDMDGDREKRGDGGGGRGREGCEGVVGRGRACSRHPAHVSAKATYEEDLWPSPKEPPTPTVPSVPTPFPLAHPHAHVTHTSRIRHTPYRTQHQRPAGCHGPCVPSTETGHSWCLAAWRP
jgi:hypothetical protein